MAGVGVSGSSIVSSPTTASFFTEHGHGQSVKFSPFSESRLACATGSEYGLQGNSNIKIYLSKY